MGRRTQCDLLDSKFKNAIDFDSGAPTMFVNRNRVDSHDVELSGSTTLGTQWIIDGSVTNAKSRIASTSGDVRNPRFCI